MINMRIFYYISFIITVFLLLRYMWGQKENNNTLLLAMICTTISNGGYLTLLVSKNLEEALLANKITYVGGCFLPVIAFMLTCELCNVEIPQIPKILMFTVQIAIYGCVCTMGYLNVYYKTAQYHEYNGIASLTKTYGPLHILYPISLAFYVILTLIVLTVSLKRKNTVSAKIVWSIYFNYLILIVVYVFERVLDLRAELMPFAYVIAFSNISRIVRKSATFSIANHAQTMFKNNHVYGYVEFDKKLHYMGCNDGAVKIIPELNQIPLDEEVAYGDNLIYHKILPALQAYKETKKNSHALLKVNDKIYEIKVSLIKNAKGVSKGYAVELTDVTEHQKYLDMVKSYNRNLESEVEEKTHKIREIQDRIIMGMAQMVESRDLSTGGHIKRTSAVIKVFSRQLLKENLGYDQEFLYYIQKSAPMHDLGKIAVDDAILRKQGKFTPEEYDIMKKHAAAGAKIVNEILTGVEAEEFVKIATNIAHYHHEKVDGSGYPKGLKGDAIPVEARIMALADVFDALVSKRCYKEAFTYDEAFAIIKDSIGTHFDRQLGMVFLKCRRQLEDLYNDFLEE